MMFPYAKPLTDTCDANWQQTRDGLVISSLIISLLGFATSTVLLVLAVVDNHLQKRKFCVCDKRLDDSQRVYNITI